MKQRNRTEKPKKGRTQTNHETKKLEQTSSMVGLNQTKQKYLFTPLLFVFLFLDSSLFDSLFLFIFSPLFCFTSERRRIVCALLFCFCCLGNEQRKNKTPCFIVFMFVLLSLQGFGNRKAKIKEENKTARRRKQKRGKLTRVNWEIGRKSTKKH